jgi:hypothetical protein
MLFNIWRTSSSSSIECPCFFHTNFFFPLPPPLVQFVLAGIMLKSQNGEFNEDGRNTPSNALNSLISPFYIWNFFDIL